MSLEKELDQKKAEQKVYISPQDVPETVEVILRDYKFKIDQKGNECCYLYLETEKGSIIVQKYTPTAFETLKIAIKGAGGFDHLKATQTTWKLMFAGRMMNKRLFPVPAPKEHQKK